MNPLDEKPRIALIGLPGSGKSRVGACLAERLGWNFADTDLLVEQRAEQAIPALVARLGWPHFRRVEREVLGEVLQRHFVVIATGGGVVEIPGNGDALKASAHVVYLEAPISELLPRLRRDTIERPLLRDAPEHSLVALQRRRGPLYGRIAHVRIDTGGREAARVADMIAEMVGNARN